MADNAQSNSKYDHLLDEELWSFIHKSESYFPADAAQYSIERQRQWYAHMCQGFQTNQSASVTRLNYPIGARQVPVRQYLPTGSSNTLCTVIYFHGGGFVVGDLESHDDVCTAICDFTHYRVISCDYKLAPEHKHPAAFLDAYEVFTQVAQQSDSKIVLAGDSAGATLAACVSSRARFDQKPVDAQVLIYPYLGGPTESGSAIEHANAPLLSTSDMEFYRQIRIDTTKEIPNDDTFAPLWCTDFSRLPDTTIFGAECDPLRDDGPLYAEQLKQAGVNVHCTVEPGLVHGYLRARHNSSKARDSFKRMLLAIQRHGA